MVKLGSGVGYRGLPMLAAGPVSRVTVPVVHHTVAGGLAAGRGHARHRGEQRYSRHDTFQDLRLVDDGQWQRRFR